LKTEHLLSAWPKLSEQIQKSERILLLIDFDGTLAPIVEKPELAELPKKTRVLLRDLASLSCFTLGIISGRALEDLKSKVKVDGLIYAGNHGFEIEGPGMNFVNPFIDELKPLFRIIKGILSSTLGATKGIIIEDKGITISIHYRQVDEGRAREVKKLVESAVNGIASRGLIKVTLGKKVYEIKPAVNWDKGKAIRLIMKKLGRGGRNSGIFPIYLGDDVSDEDAFTIIEKYGRGIAVHVGEHPSNSSARYFLRSPEEVYCFLTQILDRA
jgi:trehalose 6-phosphate phosphatase